MKRILLSIFALTLLSTFTFAQCNELFISEYVEGTSNNKAIEIYNPSILNIPLANYRLVRHDNGNSNTLEPVDPQHVLNLPPNITMPPKSVYVMALNLTDPNGTGQSAPIDLALQAVADTLLCNGCATTVGNSRVLCFNGDDALALQKNVGGTWVNVDIFACIGEQPKNNNGTASPTAGWTILPPFSSMPVGFTPAGAYFLQYWTQDKTLSRKYDVSTGVVVNPPIASFDASVQWDSLPANTFENLGAHECICNVGINEIENNLKIKSFPNPVSNTIYFVANGNIKLIEIFDITGKLQQRIAISNITSTTNVDVQNLSTGMYFAKILDTKENSKLVKFSKN
jgi:hypothetical protein